MEHVDNSTKKHETPVWMQETPCGDKSHAHQDAAFEAAARSMCGLPKVKIAHKVDGVCKQAIEHHPSVRRELVLAANNITAKHCVQKQEQHNLEAKQEEIRSAETAAGEQKVIPHAEKSPLEKSGDDVKRGGLEIQEITSEDEREWKMIDLNEQDRVVGKETTEQGGVDMDNWELVEESEVLINEDYIFRQVHSAQGKQCVLQ